MTQFVPYRRVSTQRQGQSGLGLEAQEYLVKQYLDRAGTVQVLAEFTEIETGKNPDRPELAKAIALCRETGATLLVAKLDRLSRRCSLVFSLRDSGVKFICADNPEANDLTIGILAVLAEHEGKAISQRTKDALAAAKRRGVALGMPAHRNSSNRDYVAAKVRTMNAARLQRHREHREKLVPVVNELREAKVDSLTELARCLNARGYKTVSGREFCAETVKALIT